MIRRTQAKIIDQEIKEQPNSFLSQKILGIGIFLGCAYFLFEIILEYLGYRDYSMRKLVVLASFLLFAICGFIIGYIERRKDKSVSHLGAIGNLSLVIFYAYVIFHNDYHLLIL